VDARDVGHARRGIGGRPRRVVLHRFHEARGFRLPDFRGFRVIREVQRHERLELRALRERRQNAIAIRRRFLHVHDRRLQVRHHDGPGEFPRRGAHHIRHRLPVAQVRVGPLGELSAAARHISLDDRSGSLSAACAGLRNLAIGCIERQGRSSDRMP